MAYGNTNLIESNLILNSKVKSELHRFCEEKSIKTIEAFYMNEESLDFMETYISDKSLEGVKKLEIFRDLHDSISGYLSTHYGTSEVSEDVSAEYYGCYDKIKKYFINMDKLERHGNLGNAHAKKYSKKLNTSVHIRVDTTTKNAWVNHAQPKKLSEWIVATLNKELEK